MGKAKLLLQEYDLLKEKERLYDSHIGQHVSTIGKVGIKSADGSYVQYIDSPFPRINELETECEGYKRQIEEQAQEIKRLTDMLDGADKTVQQLMNQVKTIAETIL